MKKCICGNEGRKPCSKCGMQWYCCAKCRAYHSTRHKFFCEAPNCDNVDSWFFSLYKGMNPGNCRNIEQVADLIEYWQRASERVTDKDDYEYNIHCAEMISRIIHQFQTEYKESMQELARELTRRKFSTLTCSPLMFDLLLDNGYGK